MARGASLVLRGSSANDSDQLVEDLLMKRLLVVVDDREVAGQVTLWSIVVLTATTHHAPRSDLEEVLARRTHVRFGRTEDDADPFEHVASGLAEVLVVDARVTGTNVRDGHLHDLRNEDLSRL
jgi:hypothetical protein